MDYYCDTNEMTYQEMIDAASSQLSGIRTLLPNLDPYELEVLLLELRDLHKAAENWLRREPDNRFRDCFMASRSNIPLPF